MLREAKVEDVDQLCKAVEKDLAGASSLAQAAQKAVDRLYSAYSDSLVLARFYTTTRFDSLPSTDRAFVETLADSKGISSSLQPATPILSLLGTRGVEQAWNDRYRSEGHLGIPLASNEFVAAIPMVSRLLKDLGIPLDWLTDDVGSDIQTRTRGSMAGLFYVEDATQARDSQGRLVITAADFVQRYGVKTVFGVGGKYLVGKTCVMLILFTREHVSQATAQLFLPLASTIKTVTVEIARDQRIFR